MKANKEYNFRVGDYVETKEKDIGYITSITRQASNNDGDIFYHIEVSLEAFPFYRDSIPEMKFDGTINLIRRTFNRIGKYDFTKENKIEQLNIEQLNLVKKTSIYNGDGQSNISSDYIRVYDKNELDDEVIDKINELVEAVNELRSNKNE